MLLCVCCWSVFAQWLQPGQADVVEACSTVYVAALCVSVAGLCVMQGVLWRHGEIQYEYSEADPLCAALCVLLHCVCRWSVYDAHVRVSLVCVCCC